MTQTQAANREFLVKAARMYFLDERSQDDIAHVMGTSRSNVSRMLSMARQLGIVEFRIHDPDGRDAKLEGALLERFDLAAARVAAFSPGSDLLTAVGQLAAGWLDETLRDGQVLGLSWGTALQSTVAALVVDQPRAVTAVPLVGGLSNTCSLITSQELVRELARRIGGTYRYLHGPAVIHGSTLRDALLAEPSVRDGLELARAADVALVGIGSFGTGSSADMVASLDLTTEEQRHFLASRPVGDICCRFFDAGGVEVEGAARDRVLAVELTDLRSIPIVMGVAAGPHKAPGVLAAVRNGLVRGLTVDASLAHAVLTAADSATA